MELEEAIKKVRELIEFDENLVGWQCNKNGDVCRKIYLETVLNHLTKQEKIIELMAEELEEWTEFLDEEGYYTCLLSMNKEEVKQYFEKKAEE